jgi:hypothetical protein
MLEVHAFATPNILKVPIALEEMRLAPNRLVGRSNPSTGKRYNNA